MTIPCSLSTEYESHCRFRVHNGSSVSPITPEQRMCWSKVCYPNMARLEELEMIKEHGMPTAPAVDTGLECLELVEVGSDVSTDSENSAHGSHGLGTSRNNSIEHNKALFRAASRFINPSRVFRFVIYLYGERKLLVFFWLHFIATMTIWVHFGLIKFEEQRATVPEGAAFYWWKRVAPSLEFGSMHAILFQMALLPLTMSRYSIAALSGTAVEEFVPLNRAFRIHIHLGYVMVSIVFLATIFFFIFFGILCSGGEEDFCDKFTSEIMCTGYGILASLLIIGGTSYFRNSIPYEVFYAVHHLVFAMYLITIIHTVDSVQRNNERNRSQTFKWFSSTILWYVCDRVAMRLNHNYQTSVKAATSVRGSDGSRMLLVKIKRPVLFQFQPGQYAYLKNSLIDQHWHPFSIASDPSSRFLEFYIDVFGPETWTGRLWELLKEEGNNRWNEDGISIQVMGPYGTSLGKMENFSHGLLIGTGSGIVPIVSAFKQHVCNVIRFSPQEYFRASEENSRLRMEYELAHDARKSSFAKRLASLLWTRQSDPDPVGLTKMDFMQRSIRSFLGHLQDSHSHHRLDAKMLRWAASEATKSIYGVLVLAFLSVLGATIFGLTISWNTIPIDLYSGMTIMLKLLTVLFQVCFAIPAVFIWDGNNFFAFVDFAACLVAIPADYLWFQEYEKNGVLDTVDTFLFCLLTGYMVARLWFRTVCHLRSDWKHGAMKRLEIVWVARSASLISEILPDINTMWQSILDKWGLEDACKVCRFSVYCTDKDDDAVDELISALSGTSLYQQGFIHLGRPDFQQIVQDQTVEVINESRTSNTLLAFCGSPKLAEIIQQVQVSIFMLAAITGHKKHQMHFVSESYGGVRKGQRRQSDSGVAEANSPRVPKKSIAPKVQVIVRHENSHIDDEAPSL